MKASKWEFRRYLPDEEDVEVLLREGKKVVSKSRIKMNPSERNMFMFNAGFYRGMAWALAKMQKEKI